MTPKDVQIHRSKEGSEGMGRAIDKVLITAIVALVTAITTRYTPRSDAALSDTQVATAMEKYSPWARDKAGVEAELRGVKEEITLLRGDLKALMEQNEQKCEKLNSKIDLVSDRLSQHAQRDNHEQK